MNKAILASVAGVALAFGVAACSNEAEVPVDAAADAPAGLTVSDARMNIPAVAGNPGAVYFTLTNGGSEALMLRSASVVGAESTTLHATSEYAGQMTMAELVQLPIDPGESLTFEPGGNHVMVMGLPEGLEPGGEMELTLTFLRGAELTFPVRLLAPGDDGSGN